MIGCSRRGVRPCGAAIVLLLSQSRVEMVVFTSPLAFLWQNMRHCLPFKRHRRADTSSGMVIPEDNCSQLRLEESLETSRKCEKNTAKISSQELRDRGIGKSAILRLVRRTKALVGLNLLPRVTYCCLHPP